MVARLVIDDGAAAIAFYQHVFGAHEVERYVDLQGRIVHVELRLGNVALHLTEENPASHNVSPARLGGSAVQLQLTCEDPDRVQSLAVQRNATVIFPVTDQFYGRREGRIRDPFGHLWILTKASQAVSPEPVQPDMEEPDTGGNPDRPWSG